MIVDQRSCRMRAASSVHPNKMYGDSGADTSSGLHQLRYGEKKFTPTKFRFGRDLWGLLFLVGWQRISELDINFERRILLNVYLPDYDYINLFFTSVF